MYSICVLKVTFLIEILNFSWQNVLYCIFYVIYKSVVIIAGGDMLYNLEHIALYRVSPTAYLEIGATTTLMYYIIDELGVLDVSSIEFKLDVIKGRDSTGIVGWTSVATTTASDSTYNFDITLPSTIKGTDQLLLTIKVTDANGTEVFLEESEVRAI